MSTLAVRHILNEKADCLCFVLEESYEKEQDKYY